MSTSDPPPVPAKPSSSSRPLLPARPHSDPGASDPHARRRRTSVSGKLLSLFSKPKAQLAAPAPPVSSTRPVISRPQPLERRVSDTHTTANGRHVLPDPVRTRRKRDYLEASLDENNARLARATSRQRLDSDASTSTIRPSQSAAPSASGPALKSALKQPAAQQKAKTKGLLSTRFSHTRAKAALKPTTGHNRGAPPPSSFSPLPEESSQSAGNKSVLGRGINPSSASALASSSQSTSATTTRARNAPQTQKKTVTFAVADEQQQQPKQRPRMSLKRAPTLRAIPPATDHWTDLASEIAALSLPSNAAPPEITFSGPSSTAPSTTRKPPTSTGSRRESEPVFTPAATRSSRSSKALPFPPQLSTDAEPEVLYESQRPDVRTGSRSQFRDVLALQTPPTPEAALKLAPFQLPASIKRRADDGNARGRGASKEKENLAGSSGLLEEVLLDMARDQETRERGRSAAKQTTTPLPKQLSLPNPPSVLKRFTVDIVPGARHTTLWDGQDTDVYAWQGTLEVRDLKPASYFYPRHAIHDVSISFHTASEPREDPITFDPARFSAPSSSSSPNPTSPTRPARYEWQTTYTGHRLSSALSSAAPETPPTLDPAHGIALSRAPLLRAGDDPDGPCTWLVHFWVPLPLRLFARAEHRTFVCRARVTVRDWETPETVVPGGCVAVGVERLKTARLLAGAGR